MTSPRLLAACFAAAMATSSLVAPGLILAQADLRCTLGEALSRFTVISTKDKTRSDLYLGSDASVGTSDISAVCSLPNGVCECPKLRCATEGEPCSMDSECPDGTCAGGACVCLPVSCARGGERCIGDEDCLVASPAECELATHACRCPVAAAGCLMNGQTCSADRDCDAPLRPLGNILGGLCGNDMRLTAGSRTGLLATRGDVSFGNSTKCRPLRVAREFANTASGRVEMTLHPPFLGAMTRINDGSNACALDGGCENGCITGRRLVVGLNAHPLSSSDGQSRRGLAGTGSSRAFKLCDAALSLIESTGNDDDFGPSPFQTAIEKFVPLTNQRLVLGAATCLACPLVTTPDRGCTRCAADDILQTRERTQKLVIVLGGGLQVLDVRRLALQGNTVLELRGQRDTVALLRVAEDIHLGGESKVLLESNGAGKGRLQTDKVLWVAKGIEGGRPTITRASTFRGTLLASGREGVRIGGSVLVEGALWGRKVSIGRESTLQHYPFSELFPLPGSSVTTFVPAASEPTPCPHTLS